MMKDEFIIDFELEEAQESSLQMVLEFFAGDEAKAAMWFETPNPMLGEIKPYIMFITRPQKLERVIRDMLEGNRA